MIDADGMAPHDVRCDVCNTTQRNGASCMPGLPCGLRRSMTAPRCPGTWRSRRDIEAMLAAHHAALEAVSVPAVPGPALEAEVVTEDEPETI